MAEWLASQGFRVSPPYEGFNKVQTMVDAVWPVEKDSTFRPFGSWSSQAAQKTIIFILSAISSSKSTATPYQITISYLKNGNIETDAGQIFL
jgi:hypothetical protein